MSITRRGFLESGAAWAAAAVNRYAAATARKAFRGRRSPRSTAASAVTTP